jgi:uncharacterized protein with GYD domain
LKIFRDKKARLMKWKNTASDYGIRIIAVHTCVTEHDNKAVVKSITLAEKLKGAVLCALR